MRNKDDGQSVKTGKDDISFYDARESRNEALRPSRVILFYRERSNRFCWKKFLAR